MALPEALKDADEAIKQDPTFIKAYIRKALVQQGMKEHTSALETLQKATDKDVDNKSQREIEQTMTKVMMELQSQRSTETDEETYQRAMRDPEVAEIMADPIMRQILSDAQQNPKALQDHMKNPMIGQKSESECCVLSRLGWNADTCRSPEARQLGYHPHQVMECRTGLFCPCWRVSSGCIRGSVMYASCLQRGRRGERCRVKRVCLDRGERQNLIIRVSKQLESPAMLML
jgi:hypothetical protein